MHASLLTRNNVALIAMWGIIAIAAVLQLPWVSAGALLIAAVWVRTSLGAAALGCATFMFTRDLAALRAVIRLARSTVRSNNECSADMGHEEVKAAWTRIPRT